MSEPDGVRRFLQDQGCDEEVIKGGLAGLVSDWERVVEQVTTGYPLGLDDYLNDMDGRQLLERALDYAPATERDAARERERAADLRMQGHVTRSGECLWGEKVADAETWTPEYNWWYFNLPRAPGPLLTEDLRGF